MHKTVEGQTDSLLKDWAILLLTPGYQVVQKLSVFKKKVPKLFHWKNKRSCAVRTCNYGR
jgi:hypothetical protein